MASRRNTQAALLLLMAVLPVTGATAQEVAAPMVAADPLEDLKARVERLEKKNAELSRALQERRDPSAESPPDLAPASPTEPTTDPTALATPAAKPTWKMDWNNGLRFSRSDDRFKFHVGGSAFFDYGWNGIGSETQFGPGGTGEFQDGALMRRSRIRMDGTMFNNIDFVSEFDFSNTFINDDGVSNDPVGTVRFVQVAATVTQLPVVGNLRIGYFAEPLGLGHDWMFMERAPGLDSIYANAPGAMIFNVNEAQTMTWAVGIFHDTENTFGFGIGDGKMDTSARLTWLPWYEDDGEEVVHTGIGFSRREIVNGQIRLRGRPSVRTMPGSVLPSLADTGVLNARDQDIFNVELAGVYGPWTLKTQYFATFLHDVQLPDANIANGTLFYQGTYVQLSWLLTGEHQRYNRKTANFDRVIPRQNFEFSRCGASWGAWEVGIRYGYLDLQNRDVSGATLHDIVLGLNWYLNPCTAVQWNLAIDHRTPTIPGSEGWSYIFGGRLAFEF
jgi:phosphate-selective porin OprO/OprP